MQLDKLIELAKDQRVWLEVCRLAREMTPPHFVAKTDHFTDFDRRADWVGVLDNYADWLADAMSRNDIQVALIKGSVAQDRLRKHIRSTFLRDQLDVDCCVADFADFIALAKTVEAHGTGLKRISLRHTESGIAGAAEFSKPVDDRVFYGINLECQIGGQHLSRFAMRRYDAAFWQTTQPLSKTRSLPVPDGMQSLLVLAGEVFENGQPKLRDLLDMQALQSQGIDTDTAALGKENRALLTWFAKKIEGFAAEHGLPFDALTAVGSNTDHPMRGKLSWEARYETARKRVLDTHSDRRAAHLRRYFPLTELWDRGCYIDAVRLNRSSGPLPPPDWRPETPLLPTPIGDFLLVPFGIVTTSDLDTLHQELGARGAFA